MNTQQPVLSQVQPAIPLPNGRPLINGHYSPSPHPPQHPPYYPGYQYQYPMPYHRGPQQWTPYQVPMPVQRGYPPYPQMTHYPIPQHIPPMRPDPHQPISPPPIRSVQGMLSPSPSNTSLPPRPSPPIHSPNPHLAPPTPPPPPSTPSPVHRTPFYPPLPWHSWEGTFPPRASRRRRRTPAPQSSSTPVEFPSRRGSVTETESSTNPEESIEKAQLAVKQAPRENHTLETPSTSHPPSEDFSTQPTTPSSTSAPQQTTPKINPAGRPTLPIQPIIPAIPNLPALSRPAKKASTSLKSDVHNNNGIGGPTNADHMNNAVKVASQSNYQQTEATDKSTEDVAPHPTKTAPKSWADLVRTKASPKASPNENQADDGVTQSDLFNSAKAGSLADALSSYNVKDSSDAAKLAFLEPRGLVNTGNMCYMNSILQVLVFCVPFYNFLEKIGKQAAHSFKSDTPLMDAMMMFMREFTVIDAAISVDQLRMRLKDNELEQYGDAFIPEFVYDVIRRLPRFSSMRRGHQQDAEEFLGFILEEMHDECSRAMKSTNLEVSNGISTPANGVQSPNSESVRSPTTDDGDWLEVGPKQRAATTRSSGAIVTESPVTKIFGGKLRSELRVSGKKNSVTLEPYQPLQLDIGAPHVSNIIDALKNMTKSETLHGEFNSPRGPGSTATKQVTIETLPQVLILHLKRFQYDSSGGTQKIWKKVGYPLELEIPKELFPQHKRGGLQAHGGLPKYRLIGVVYHHGKNAGGGHYTVDVRRQEGREWIRLDDTVIRRIRSEDVAEGGSEEDPKVLAAALEQHKRDPRQANVYEQFSAEEEERKEDAGKGWSQVNGSSASSSSTAGGKKWSGIANGNATPTANSSGKMTPVGRTAVKESKVAYILFYERINV